MTTKIDEMSKTVEREKKKKVDEMSKQIDVDCINYKNNVQFNLVSTLCSCFINLIYVCALY
jgi:hypothetical protein